MNDDSHPRERTTEVLSSLGTPDWTGVEEIIPFIYEELHHLAHRQLAGERPDHTLRTTALVHEAYFKLVDDDRVTSRGRAFFFGAAARAMRQVLIDHARRRTAQKRGGGEKPLSLEDEEVAVDNYAAELLDLDRALETLADLNPRHATVVECRFFGGLSVEETAAALEVSPRTVKYDWALARAWLYQTLREPAA